MRTKEEQKQREDLEKTLKMFEKAILLRKIGVFTMYTNNIS